MPAIALTYASLLTLVPDYLERQTDESLIDFMPTAILFAQRRIAREVKVLGMQKYVVSTFSATNGVIDKPAGWLQTLSMNFGTGSGWCISCAVNDGGEDYVAPLTLTASGGGFTTSPTFSGVLVNGVVTQVVPATPGVGGTGDFEVVVAGFEDEGEGASVSGIVNEGNTIRNQLFERAYEYLSAYWPNRQLTGAPKFYGDYDFNHWILVPSPAEELPFEVAYYQVDDLLSDEQETNWLTINAPDLLTYAACLEAAIFIKSASQIAKFVAEYNRCAAGFGAEDKSRIEDRTAKRDA